MPAHLRRAQPGSLGIVDLLAMSGASLLALLVRLPGLTRGDLWTDDAWMALPSRYSAQLAGKLAVTTPLFTQLGRLWLRAWPGSTPWAQLLPLLAGVAVVPVVYLLLGRLGLRPGLRSLMAAFAAVAPAAVEYSTRFKEYSTDELLCALMLLCLVRLLEVTSWPRALALSGVVLLGVDLSGSLLVAGLGVMAGLLVAGLRHRRLLRSGPWLLGSLGSAISMLLAWALFYRHPPKALTRFWSPLELSGRGVEVHRNIGLMANGALHGLVGLPLEVGRFPLALALGRAATQRTGLQAALLGIALLACLGVAAWRAVVARGPEAALAAGAAAIVLGALGAAAIGRAPFGGGRTDLVWYPAAFVLLGLALSAATSWLGAFAWGRALGRVAVAAGLVGLVVMGAHFRAWYPAQDLRALEATIAPAQQPGDLLAVSSENSWTQALYAEPPATLVFEGHAVDTTKGFGVKVNRPEDLGLLLSRHPQQLCATSSRLWFLGIESSLVSPSAYHLEGAAAGVPLSAGSLATTLEAAGWQPQPLVAGRGVTAQLWRHPGACPAS